MKCRSVFALLHGFLCAALITAAPTAAHGQEPDSLDKVLQRAYNARWTVRAVSTPEDTIAGHVLRIGRDSVTVGHHRLAMPLVVLLERERRENSGILAGALGGGVLLAFVGMGIVPCDGDYAPCGSDQLIYAGIGLAIGSVIGAFIGGATTRDKVTWEPLWKR